MRTLSIRLVGDWVDCWLYKEHLILWDEMNQMYVASIKNVLNAIRLRYGNSAAPLVNMALFRNDWKNSAFLRDFLEVDGVMDAVSSAARHFPPVFELSLNDIRAVESTRDFLDGIVTDSVIYADRVFVSTTSGLYQTSFSTRKPSQRRPTAMVLDRPVFGVTAKYGAVNAAAHEQGLWFRSIKFGATSMEFDKRPLEQIGEYSLKIESFWRDLINYTGENFPSLLPARARKEAPHAAAQFEAWRVDGYESPMDLRSQFEGVIGSNNFAFGSPRKVLGNSDRRVLLASDDSLYSVGLSDHGANLVNASAPWHAGFSSTSRISETHALLGGFVLEEADRVSMFSKSGVARVFDGEVGRVRTFKDSLHYRQMIAIVHNEGVDLVGTFPDLDVAHEPEPNF